jgi:hypothetical protein
MLKGLIPLNAGRAAGVLWCQYVHHVTG